MAYGLAMPTADPVDAKTKFLYFKFAVNLSQWCS
jgi:hypothetical protein